jgi:RNA polymerase sigma factor (sigma-70 family)
MQPFEQVVTEHGLAVLRLCRAMLDSDADADDAWAEPFLAALRAYPQLPPGSNLEAWLITIAKRKVIDSYRRRARRPVPTDDLTLMDSVAAEGLSTERDDDLWAALRALPPKQRRAVALHHIAGMPYAEIADLLGNSEAAARRAASDGLKRLRSTYVRSA